MCSSIVRDCFEALVSSQIHRSLLKWPPFSGLLLRIPNGDSESMIGSLPMEGRTITCRLFLSVAIGVYDTHSSLLCDSP